MTRISCFFVVVAISLLAKQSHCFPLGDRSTSGTGDNLIPAVVDSLNVPLVTNLVDGLLRSPDQGFTSSTYNGPSITGEPVTLHHKRASDKISGSLRRRQKTLVLNILDNINSPSFTGTSLVPIVLAELKSSAPVIVKPAPSTTHATSTPVADDKPISDDNSTSDGNPIIDSSEDDDSSSDSLSVDTAPSVVAVTPPVHPSFLGDNVGVSTIPVKKVSTSASASSSAHVARSMAPIAYLASINGAPSAPEVTNVIKSIVMETHPVVYALAVNQGLISPISDSTSSTAPASGKDASSLIPVIKSYLPNFGTNSGGTALHSAPPAAIKTPLPDPVTPATQSTDKQNPVAPSTDIFPLAPAHTGPLLMGAVPAVSTLPIKPRSIPAGGHAPRTKRHTPLGPLDVSTQSAPVDLDLINLINSKIGSFIPAVPQIPAIPKIPIELLTSPGNSTSMAS